MSVKIRLSLRGKTHQISYRLVAQDTRSKRDGKFLEILGYFNPSLKDEKTKINKDRIKYYMSHGATLTPTAKFLVDKGELPPRPKKIREKKEQQVAQAPSQSKDAEQLPPDLATTVQTPEPPSTDPTSTQPQSNQTEPGKAEEVQTSPPQHEEKPAVPEEATGQKSKSQDDQAEPNA